MSEIEDDVSELEDDVSELEDGFDPAAGARGAVYAFLSRAFVHPDEPFHAALASGDAEAQLASLLDATGLEFDRPRIVTDDDYETLCARYNDLFVVGHSAYRDRTDGTLAATGPPVPVYESAYRSDASWTDVNLDLARAYDFYDLAIDEAERYHHDAAHLQLEFAGYLARREAVVDDGAAAARLDHLDRHLRVLTRGMAERIADEPATGAYGRLVDLLASFSAADRDDLVDRLEGR